MGALAIVTAPVCAFILVTSLTSLRAQQIGGGRGGGIGLIPVSAVSSNGVTPIPLYFPDGSSTVPSIAWTSDVGGVAAGFYRPGAGRIAWVSSNATRFEIGSDYAQVPVTAARLILNSLTFKQDSTSGFLLSGTAPTITGAFGTAQSIAGTNAAFTVNVGTTPAASGIVTFAGTYTNAPMCSGNMSTTTDADMRTLGITSTTSTVTVKFYVGATATTPTASTSFVVHCDGR